MISPAATLRYNNQHDPIPGRCVRMATAALKSPAGFSARFYDYDLDIVVHIPREAHTLDGFRAWVLSRDFPEKLKAIYHQGGVFLDMAKEDINAHALVKTEVGRVVANLNEEVDFGHLFINGVLLTNAEADVSNNPDALAVFWNSLSSGRVRYVKRRGREMEIAGSPDWALEIVSTGSVWKDTQLLRTAYHRAGIREYWIIDARGDDLIFTVLHWRKTGYVAAAPKDGWLRSQVFERSFQLTRERDRSGAWKYRLAVK
jgi:Uma2 family endonuclease